MIDSSSFAPFAPTPSRRRFGVGLRRRDPSGVLRPASSFSVSAPSRARMSVMSAIFLRRAVGSMPCSVLYATCFSRRRLVSSIARIIESVMLSAYMCTSPPTLRAARPMVWISEVPDAQEPLFVGVENRDERDFGKVETLAQKVDTDENVVNPGTQFSQEFDAAQGVDIRVQVAHVDTVLGHEGRQPLPPSSWSAS